PCDRMTTEAGCFFVHAVPPEVALRSVRGEVAMQNKSAEVTPRGFNPMSAPGLSDEARKAVSAAFDAMSTWRTETAQSNEKNIEQVIEKMAAAARALGWPEQIVDASAAVRKGAAHARLEIRCCKDPQSTDARWR